jgi:hypothetical protein
MIRNMVVIIILIGLVTPGYAKAANCNAKNYMKANDWIKCTHKCQKYARMLKESAAVLANSLRAAADKNNPIGLYKENIGNTKNRYKGVKLGRRLMSNAIKDYRKCIKKIQLPDAVRLK